jgi:hypothetical protein
MSAWQNYLTDLDQKLSANPDSGLAKLSEPIDRGADKTLLKFRNDWTRYPLLQVEYLLRTLNEHLKTCLELRAAAQDLEAKAVFDAMQAVHEKNLLGLVEEQLKLASDLDRQKLANLIGASLDRNKLVGTQSGDWDKLLAVQLRQVAAQRENAEMRLFRLSETGAGTNFFTRFENIKRLFSVDFQEAYRRACSVEKGLKLVYQLDRPLPEISDVGYLDSLVEWARNSTYELEKLLLRRQQAEITLALQSGTRGAADAIRPTVLEPKPFESMRDNGGTFTFSLTAEHFSLAELAMKNPRIRSLRWMVRVNLPPTTNFLPVFWKARATLPEQPGAGLDYRISTILPPTASNQISEEILEMRELANASPIGEWTLKLDGLYGVFPTTSRAMPEQIKALENVMLAIGITYDR